MLKHFRLTFAKWKTDKLGLAKTLHETRATLGIGRNTTSHSEKLLSALGAFLGIFLVYVISTWYLADVAALVMLASMGASAVLVFAVPHGSLSQPWAVLAGHLVSAAMGVTAHGLFPGHMATPALAVGMAVGAMYYLRCIHPPGGATALVAVIGGPTVHSLGFQYLLTPVLFNALTLVVTAALFNSLFSWRRYPAHWGRRPSPARPPTLNQRPAITQEDLAAAMQELNSYVDVTTDELIELMELARAHADRQVEHPESIMPGRFYSNGELGNRWCVRQVIDAEPATNTRKDRVIYKNLAGAGAFETGLCDREEFRQWARFEVIQHKGRWMKANIPLTEGATER